MGIDVQFQFYVDLSRTLYQCGSLFNTFSLKNSKGVFLLLSLFEDSQCYECRFI